MLGDKPQRKACDRAQPIVLVQSEDLHLKGAHG